MKKLLFTALTLMALQPGCSQGEGDVCQIDSDCEDGLECNAGTQRCQMRGRIGVDAAPPRSDAAPSDAAVDPPFDAAPFDAAVSDAAPLDAALPAADAAASDAAP